MADFIPFEHDKGPVGVGQTLSIRRHDEGTPRNRGPPHMGHAQRQDRPRTGCARQQITMFDTTDGRGHRWCSELS